MGSQAEVQESHEQFSAAWSLYARCRGAGRSSTRTACASPTPANRGSS